MRLDFRALGHTPSPYRRARSAGVGLALLGAVGLGLAAVPNCGGGGATGDNAVHLESSGAVLAVGVAAPHCGGGGGTGDDAAGGGAV